MDVESRGRVSLQEGISSVTSLGPDSSAEAGLVTSIFADGDCDS